MKRTFFLLSLVSISFAFSSSIPAHSFKRVIGDQMEKLKPNDAYKPNPNDLYKPNTNDLYKLNPNDLYKLNPNPLDEFPSNKNDKFNKSPSGLEQSNNQLDMINSGLEKICTVKKEKCGINQFTNSYECRIDSENIVVNENENCGEY